MRCFVVESSFLVSKWLEKANSVGAYCDLHVRLQKAVFGHDDDSSRLFRCIILALVI